MGCCSSATREAVREAFTDLAQEFPTEAKPQKQPPGAWRFVAPDQDYAQRAVSAIPASVIVFSGCKDSQTSADVSDVSSFGLPVVSNAQKAGGACTNGLLSTLQQTPNVSYGNLLILMQQVLRQRGYEQIPQLSSSHQTNLRQQTFSVRHPDNPSGRTRALLVGINYVGQRGQLNGCVNDVRMMERYLTTAGYSTDPASMRILTDDPSYGSGLPTNRNILEGFRWLTEGAQSGDALFVHYSGHGTSVRDNEGDEADGRDEAVVPLDYQHGGVITDDTIYQMLVSPLPVGAQLIGLFDCCHSGTIVDLPFVFNATDEAVEQLNSGSAETMGTNSAFDFSFAEMLSNLASSGKIFSAMKMMRDGHPPSEVLMSILSSAGHGAQGGH